MENVRIAVQNLLAEMDKVVVGYDDPKRKILLAVLADVHVLLESVPGLAKTLLIETLQQTISGSTHDRIQFTPDLKPQDIVGFRVFNQGTKAFDDETGPVIGNNFVLADEINRSPGKTQSALLSAMQERRVHIGRNRYELTDPFLVLATMNPIEQEGTFPLPEAQLDRFAMKIRLDYVSAQDEIKMLKNQALEGRDAHKLVTPVLSVEEVVELKKQIKAGIYVADALYEYVVNLVRATRPGSAEFAAVIAKREAAEVEHLIRIGASPRAEQTLIKMSRVRAAMVGRDFVLPDDVLFVAKDVLRHRIMLTDDAVLDNVHPDEPISMIIKAVPIVQDQKLFQRR